MSKSLLFILLLTSTVSWAADEDPAEIVRRAFMTDADIFDAARDYTYTRHRVVTQFDKNGTPKVTEDDSDEILVLYGKPYEKHLRKDGKDLSAKDAAREEEKLNKELERRRKRAAKPGEKEANEKKELEERQRALTELLEAFNFRTMQEEAHAGREAWIIEATPKKGFRAKTSAGKIYPKLSGKLWIDKADTRLVKVEAHVDEKISFGWFILQLQPGAIFEHERTRQDDGIWLPTRDLAKGRAKIGGLKTIQAAVETTYSDYRKFQVESTIQAVLEP